MRIHTGVRSAPRFRRFFFGANRAARVSPPRGAVVPRPSTSTRAAPTTSFLTSAALGALRYFCGDTREDGGADGRPAEFDAATARRRRGSRLPPAPAPPHEDASRRKGSRCSRTLPRARASTIASPRVDALARPRLTFPVFAGVAERPTRRAPLRGPFLWVADADRSFSIMPRRSGTRRPLRLGLGAKMNASQLGPCLFGSFGLQGSLYQILTGYPWQPFEGSCELWLESAELSKPGRSCGTACINNSRLSNKSYTTAQDLRQFFGQLHASVFTYASSGRSLNRASANRWRASDLVRANVASSPADQNPRFFEAAICGAQPPLREQLF